MISGVSFVTGHIAYASTNKTNSVGGQVHGDKDRVPIQWHNQLLQSLEEGCWNASLRVWRKGAGKRAFEFGGTVPESEPSSLEEGCRKASLRIWRKGAGKRAFEFGGRVPEGEPWSVKQ